MKGTEIYVSPFLWLREDTGFSQFNVEVTRIGEEWQGGRQKGGEGREEREVRVRGSKGKGSEGEEGRDMRERRKRKGSEGGEG